MGSDFLTHDPDRIWKCRDAVLSAVSLVDLLREYGAEVQEVSSGNFSHKTCCPLPLHYGRGNGGQERTASFYLSKNNDFYCFGCISENEWIWTANGLKMARNVMSGECVLDGHGRLSKVLAVIPRNGSLLGVETAALRDDACMTTPNHPFITISRDDALRELKCLGKDRSKRFGMRYRSGDHSIAALFLRQVSADKLCRGDLLLMPITPNKLRHTSAITGHIRKYTKGPQTKRISKLSANEQAAYLYGLWLAKGSCGQRFLRFSFSLMERHTLADRTRQLLQEVFGCTSSAHVRPDKTLCEIICSKADLTTLFAQAFGTGAAHKRIPGVALSWPQGVQRALVRGWMDGDAGGTISRELAYGMFGIAVQAGLLPSLSWRPPHTDKNGIFHQQSWVLSLYKRPSIRAFTICVGDTTYFCSPVIKKKDCTSSTQPVVDISVESGTFVTRMALVHNCSSFGNAIDLISLIEGIPPHMALEKLAARAGLLDENGEWDADMVESLAVEKEPHDPRKTVDPYMMDVSIALRRHLAIFVGTRRFDEELAWTEAVGERVDGFIDRIGHEDWELARDMRDKVLARIERRRKGG